MLKLAKNLIVDIDALCEHARMAMVNPLNNIKGQLTSIIRAMMPSSDPALILPSPDVTTSFPRAIESMNVSSGWCMARSGFGVSSANTDKCNNRIYFSSYKKSSDLNFI